MNRKHRHRADIAGSSEKARGVLRRRELCNRRRLLAEAFFETISEHYAKFDRLPAELEAQRKALEERFSK